MCLVVQFDLKKKWKTIGGGDVVGFLRPFFSKQFIDKKTHCWCFMDIKLCLNFERGRTGCCGWDKKG